MKKVALHNLGCKVNAYETEAMQEMLEHAGYEIVPFQEGADIYVINTCTVTNIADRKSRQMLHRARKMNPDAVVVAAGCYVQAQAEKQVIDPCIDIVLGNNKKQDLLTALQAYEEAHGDLREVIDINHTKEYENLHLTKQGEHTRAYIKVQDGCNQFCSYCIIPYARGRVRSRAKEDVVAEVTDLAKNGYQEVVLTGIHLSSYGIDFENEDNLLSLIRAVHEIPGVRRIRLGSLEPGIITEEFVKELSEMEKVCPHFHLSLQSGSDTVLKRMNRKYTAEEYFHKCELLREYYEHPAITTDIIVGFPGETEEEFSETCAFVKKAALYEIHVFKYSRRDGTVAARMPDQIPERVKSERSRTLMEIAEELKADFIRWYEGKTVEVLFEEPVIIGGKRYYEGFTPEYVKTLYPTEESIGHRIMKVEFFRELV